MPARSGRKPIAAAVALAAIAALAQAAGAPAGAHGPGAAAAERPNIVLIQTDDQNREDLTTRYKDRHGRMVAAMPATLKRLVHLGVTLANYYATEPICCPSRTSLLTGQYPHNTGVKTNQRRAGGYPTFKRRVWGHVLPAWLQAAGYETAHVGKFLNYYGDTDPAEVPPGWDQWLTLTGDEDARSYYGYRLNLNGTVTGPVGSYAHPDPSGYRSDSPGATYNTDVLTDLAVGEIGELAAGGPFYLQLDYTAPHNDDHPGLGPQPPSRYAGTVRKRAPRDAAFNEPNVADKPKVVRVPRRMGPKLIREVDIRYRRRLEALRGVDDGVARVLDALRASGELGNTWIFFLSDNGAFQGDHRLDRAKFLAYESASHMPLVVRGPGVPRRRFSTALAANIDIAPTIARIAGAEPDRPVDGVNLLPYLRDPGETNQGDRTVLIESFEPLTAPEPDPEGGARASAAAHPRTYAALRYGVWKFVRYANEAGYEVYDLRNDRRETNSLQSKPGFGAVRDWFDGWLGRLVVCASDDCRFAVTGRVPLPRWYLRRHGYPVPVIAPGAGGRGR
ncbi:MAG: sulfatase [Solirubrobacterales bacterium]